MRKRAFKSKDNPIVIRALEALIQSNKRLYLSGKMTRRSLSDLRGEVRELLGEMNWAYVPVVMRKKIQDYNRGIQFSNLSYHAPAGYIEVTDEGAADFDNALQLLKELSQSNVADPTSALQEGLKNIKQYRAMFVDLQRLITPENFNSLTRRKRLEKLVIAFDREFLLYIVQNKEKWPSDKLFFGIANEMKTPILRMLHSIENNNFVSLQNASGQVLQSIDNIIDLLKVDLKGLE